MRKFIPAEDFNRVTFAARGQDSLVIVDKAGLEVADTDEDGNEINLDLLAALSEHPHVTEVTDGYTAPVVPVVEEDPEESGAETQPGE